MLKKRPDHPVTQAVAKLSKSPEWLATFRYRNCWVHEQPPSVDGLGIIYRRRKRWRDSSTGKSKMLGIGGGDEAEWAVDDLFRFVFLAASQFSKVLDVVIEFYIRLLEAHNISIIQDKTKQEVYARLEFRGK